MGNNVLARFWADLSCPDGPQLPQPVDERSLAGKRVTLTDMLGFYLYCNRQELKTIPTYASNASERMENRLQDETRWSSEIGYAEKKIFKRRTEGQGADIITVSTSEEKHHHHTFGSQMNHLTYRASQ